MANKNTAESPETIVSYKGFNSDWTCRGFKYEVGATYTHEGSVSACESGFHACLNPLDVLHYYPLLGKNARPNRFAVVEQSGEMVRDAGDSKIASAAITITAELSLPEFVRRAVTWMLDNVKGDDTAASGNHSQLAASGYYSQLAASGKNSVPTSDKQCALSARVNYRGLLLCVRHASARALHEVSGSGAANS